MVTKKEKKKQNQLYNARKIICSFYFEIFTLLSYIRKVKIGNRLIQDGDSEDYKVLLKSTVVAVPRDQSADPPFKPSNTQWFTLKEITNRVIEHVCRGNKSNVIASGFEPLSGNDRSGTVAGTVGIQNSYPNTLVSYLRTAKAWQVLHERIGDDMMIHLLQNVAVFVKGPSKCYFQLTGFPISRLTPLTDKDRPPLPQLTDNSEKRTPPSDVFTKRKTRRGGKRVKRCQKNAETTASPSLVSSNHLDPAEFRKRRAISFNGAEEPLAKKARTSFNVIESPTSHKFDNAATSSFQADREATCNFTVQCVDDDGSDLCRNQEKEVSVMPGEKKGTLKRKKFISSDEVKEEELNKAVNTKKPLEFLLKLFPQSGQSKSESDKEHVAMSQDNSQTQKKVRLSNREGSPTLKKGIRGICLNEVYLPRSRLFYASNLSQSSPKNHVMKTTPVSRAGARRLVQHIFLQGSCLSSSGEKCENKTPKKTTVVSSNRKRKPFRLPKRLTRIQPIILKFLARHQKCPFRTLLRHHCFYTQRRIRMKRSGKKKGNLPRIIIIPKRMVRRPRKRVKRGAAMVTVYRYAVGNYTKQVQVVRFLECIIHRVVPGELWGSSQNKQKFLCNLAKFVQLHRGEKFSLGQMMSGIKVSCCEWLKLKGGSGKHVPPTDTLKQQKLLAQFIWWFVTQYLVTVLKSFFYITESGIHRQRMFYYRKPVWAKIQQFGVDTFCGKFFKSLKTKDAEKLLSSKSSLGFSPLRFVPKSSTVRPITNMRHCPVSNAQKQQSVNRKLQNLFEVLKFEKERNPNSLGATLFGSDDLYKVLKPFAKRIRECSEERPLHFVHVDVSHCYESIPHGKLFEILKEVFEEEEYLIRRFTLLRMSAGKVLREFVKHVSTADDCRSFPDFFRSLVTAWKLKQVIAVDHVWYITEDRDKLIDLLKEHIFNNIVRIGNNYYQQIRGIAQGSILSTILCGYFYSHMEKIHLAGISQDPDSLLLRWVDDFLLITPRKSLATKFLNVMHVGIPEYGCSINHDKTLTNFDVVMPDGREVKRINVGERFPWCGYLLDTVTLEVRSDFSRYTGLLLRDTLSVALDAHPGQALSRKLFHSVRPKCHPLLMDSELNTRESILCNVYQLFLLTANKFHTYTKELPRGRQPRDNPSFFCGMILGLAQYVHSASRRKSRQLSGTFSLDEREVTWLCFHAFRTCLRKRQSRYGEVLRFLRRGLSRLGGPTEEFKKVTDSSQHTVFKGIR